MSSSYPNVASLYICSPLCRTLLLYVQYHDVGATIAGEILDFLTSKNLQLSHQVRIDHGHMAPVMKGNLNRSVHLICV